MDLFLLRHANADTTADTDDERPLSEKGIAQSRKVARFCELHQLVPEMILTSPLRRARETAEIVVTHFRVELLVVPWLASGMEAETALNELRSYDRFARVMIVGHEPDFSELAAHLLGGEAHIHLRKGSLTQIELRQFKRGAGRLEFSLPPRLMEI